jgi:hypothetical protein
MPFLARRRRHATLQQRFGPEYEREVRARGSERDADQYLSEIADRRDRLDIRSLEPAARDRYTQRWQAVQTERDDLDRGPAGELPALPRVLPAPAIGVIGL